MQTLQRAQLALLLLLLSLLGSTAAHGQRASWPVDPESPAYWWIGGALVLAAAASDEAVERHSLAHRSATLDDLARAGDVLGRGRTLIPAMGLTYLTGRLTKRRPLVQAVTHTAAAYLAGDLVISVGKPVIGRHRPDTLGSPWRFRPFSARNEWFSLPSGHTMHAFTLAGAISEEARRPWVTAASYGVAALVGWSRTYHDEHWASDVVFSAVVGAAIGHATVRWLHGRTTSPPLRLRR